jgi:hypothetical protein
MYTEEQYNEFAKKMEAKHPAMFENKYGGFAVGAGWWPIIESLCANIQSHTDWWNTNRKDRPIVEQVVVEQIKEKFGGLRFYYQGGDDTIAGMVLMAESWADHSCEECGAPGTRRHGGWVRTLCDLHEAERQARIEQQARKDGLEL